VMGAVATHAINPWLFAKMPYDPIRDFTPITGVAQVPNVLVMNPETADRLGIRSVADLVAYAKKNPGKLNYGSGGNGSAGHLAGEMFKAQAGVFMVHIPYAGGNPAQLALLSGQVDLNFDNLAAASANIKAGKLRALAVTTARRASAVPELPTSASTACRAVGLSRRLSIALAETRVSQTSTASVCPNQSQSPISAALVDGPTPLPIAKRMRATSESPNIKPASAPDPSSAKSSRANDRGMDALAATTGAESSRSDSASKERSVCTSILTPRKQDPTLR